MKTPTQFAIAHGIRTYGLDWFMKLTKSEREKIIRAYVAGHRNGRNSR